MKDPVMIEIVHDFSKPERENVESRLNNFGSKQLANVLTHLKAGYTEGIDVM